MKALLDATGWFETVAALAERHPTPLIPIANKPIAHHVIEFLVEHGVTEIHLLRSHRPEDVERDLGDGARWGARFVYHLTRDASTFLETVRAVCAGWDESAVCLGRADELPLFDFQALGERDPDTPHGVLCRDPKLNPDDEASWRWSGWAVAPTDRVGPELPDALADTEDLVHAALCLSTRSYESTLASSALALQGAFPVLKSAGVETPDGARLGRDVVVHPTAHIIPPVVIGDHCRLGPGVNVGPTTVIGDHCILEDRSLVEQSIVLAGSYIGDALEVRRSIVDGGLLVNVEADAAVTVTDRFLLSDVRASGLSHLATATLSRLTAVMALAVLAPAMALIALALKLSSPRAPIFARRRCVRTPAEPDPATWTAFDRLSFNVEGRGGCVEALHLTHLPCLFNIAMGRMSWVGVEPRSESALRNEPEDWRRALLRLKPGWVTLAERQYGAHPTHDERYAAELYYGAQTGWRSEWQILLGIGPARRIAHEPHPIAQ